jgi:hypothetical protein
MVVKEPREPKDPREPEEPRELKQPRNPANPGNPGNLDHAGNAPNPPNFASPIASHDYSSPHVARPILVWVERASQLLDPELGILRSACHVLCGPYRF